MPRRAPLGRTGRLVLSAVQGVALALLASQPLGAQSCDTGRGEEPVPLATRGPQPSVPLAYPARCAAGRFALSVTEAGPTAVALRWSTVPGATAYTVSWGYADLAPGPARLRGEAGVGNAPAGVARAPRLLGRGALDRVAGPFAVTELSIAGLDAGSAYRWAVQALGTDGRPIGESELVTLALPTVPAPTLTATVEEGGVELRWSPVPAAATYRLLAAAGPGALIPDPERADLVATSTRIQRLAPGTYRFQVEARDAAGGYVTRSQVAQASIGPAGSGWSEPRPDLSPAAAPSADARSFPLTIRRKGAQAVELNWPMVPGAGTFAVYQAQGATPLAFAFATGAHSTTLTGLAPGVEYTLQVRARDAADTEYATSNAVTVTTEP